MFPALSMDATAFQNRVELGSLSFNARAFYGKPLADKPHCGFLIGDNDGILLVCLTKMY